MAVREDSHTYFFITDKKSRFLRSLTFGKPKRNQNKTKRKPKHNQKRTENKPTKNLGFFVQRILKNQNESFTRAMDVDV